MIKEYVVSFIENFHSFELKDVNHPLNQIISVFRSRKVL